MRTTMDALGATQPMRVATSIQLIGSCIAFPAKVYVAPDRTPVALLTALPEAFLIVVAALLCGLLVLIAGALFTGIAWPFCARRSDKTSFVACLRACYLLPSLLVAASACVAQLTIVNPKQLEVPQEKANVLLSTACRVVAQEFHVSDPSALRFSLVLVVGETQEHYTVDEKKLEFKLYMKEWDETKFAALATRLCMQQLPTHEQEARLLKEILRRSDKISPVSANRLRRDAAVGFPPPPRSPGSDCMSAVREQPCQRANSAP